MNRHENDTDAWEGLARVAKDVEPPAALEGRTVAALTKAGLLGRRRGRGESALLAAAAVVILTLGIGIGRAWPQGASAPAQGSPKYLLLLEGGRDAIDAAEESRTVEAYRAWAVALRQEGRSVTGERLGSAAIAVPSEPADTGDLRGFFVISAATLEEATAVARSCPHTARGGRVIVRPIDPT